jgi:lathosterol oxidase
MFVFDTWFYWTHIVLHYPKLWDWIHKYHHQFIEPTAFAQDAVHPIEAIVQGPMGHFITTLVYPMHPVAISAFGFLTSLYALFAHDGRSMDWNNHTMHHYYKSCNYGLYWGFWDYVCGTRYNKQKFPYDYVPSWLTEKSGTAAVKPRTRQAN